MACARTHKQRTHAHKTLRPRLGHCWRQLSSWVERTMHHLHTDISSKPPKTSTRTPDCASEHIMTWCTPVHTNNARTHTKLFALASATAGGNFRAGSNAQCITCTQTLAANLPKCAAKCLRVRRSTRMRRCCGTPLPLCARQTHSSDRPLGGHEERSLMM